MILLFCLRRPDIFSCDDLAIQRGLRMVYHHHNIDSELFEKKHSVPPRGRSKRKSLTDSSAVRDLIMSIENRSGYFLR